MKALSCTLALIILCPGVFGQDRLAPSPTAEPAKAFEWTSGNDLRFTWVLPRGVTPDDARDLVILCHGTGLDYRWGSANYKPGAFRPGEIVVSVDGPTTAENGTRLFLGQAADAAAFGAFITELRATFRPRHVYLYGHSQGSFFVCYFAGERPELVDGVVAHASGVWTWTRPAPERIPIVLMHGTADPVVPYGQSVGGRDWYLSQGHASVQLRRMPGYNHWPNGDRASECLDWCIGMNTDDPTRALAAAEGMLRLKAKDEYGYEAAPWYSGARDVLRRLEGAGPHPLDAGAMEHAPAALRERAKELSAAIDAAAERHVAALREQVRAGADLKLDGRPWLGHLLAVREDFRGVPCIEAYVADLGLDATAAEHARAARPLFQAWYGDGEPADVFRAVAAALPACFLHDGLPPDLGSRMESWFKRADALGVGADAGKLYGAVARWRSGREQGLEKYRAIWKSP